MDCIAEVPAFWFQEWFFKYISADVMLHLSVLGYTLRLGLYALLPLFGSPWAVLPIQLLHVRLLVMSLLTRTTATSCNIPYIHRA